MISSMRIANGLNEQNPDRFFYSEELSQIMNKLKFKKQRLRYSLSSLLHKRVESTPENIVDQKAIRFGIY